MVILPDFPLIFQFWLTVSVELIFCIMENSQPATPEAQALVKKDLPEIKDVHAVQELDEKDRADIERIANSIDIKDSQMVLQFGTGAQTNISEFSNSVLEDIRSKDAGFAGEILRNLMEKVQELKVDSISSEKSLVSKIPLLGSLVNSFERFMDKYDKLSTQIEEIIDELHKARIGLLKDITLLDNLYEKNLEYFHELTKYILAGEKKLHEFQNSILPSMKEKATASQDPLMVQEYHDMEQMLNRFEKKLHDLKLSKTLSLQTAPQIRLIQSSNHVLVEKIQSSILNTIPLWKNQIVITISLFRQKKALELQKEVSKTTNELLERNAEMLKTGTLEIAKESEKGIVEVETLKSINKKLIETIDETIKIQAEGRQKRALAEKELQTIENEIKAKILG